MVTESKSVVPGAGEEQKGEIMERHEKIRRATDIFIILTMVIVSQECKHVKTPNCTLFVQLDVCQFYFNKAVKRRKKSHEI